MPAKSNSNFFSRFFERFCTIIQLTFKSGHAWVLNGPNNKMPSILLVSSTGSFKRYVGLILQLNLTQTYFIYFRLRSTAMKLCSTKQCLEISMTLPCHSLTSTWADHRSLWLSESWLETRWDQVPGPALSKSPTTNSMISQTELCQHLTEKTTEPQWLG